MANIGVPWRGKSDGSTARYILDVVVVAGAT